MNAYQGFTFLIVPDFKHNFPGQHRTVWSILVYFFNSYRGQKCNCLQEMTVHQRAMQFTAQHYKSHKVIWVELQSAVMNNTEVKLIEKISITGYTC